MSDPKKPTPRRPKITIGDDIALGRYSNFVSIAHNFSEVLLDFGRTMPGRQDIPVVARIVMSPFHAKQLLRAITASSWRFYVNQSVGRLANAMATASAASSARHPEPHLRAAINSCIHFLNYR